MFSKILTIEELKKAYRGEALKHHPDRGGNEEYFKTINNQYQKRTKELLNSTEEQEKKEGFKETSKTMQDYQEIINRIIKYTNINIEICGTWLWVSGETKDIKEILKELGFYWAKQKVMWYYRPEEYKVNSRKSHSMDYIREKYGSEKVKSSDKKQVS